MREATGLGNWIPYQLLPTESKLCRWLYVGDKKFTEPFFQDTITVCKRFDYNTARIRCVSTLDFLEDAVAKQDTVEPSVIIFHISRCGSTLASQLLSLNEETIVLSEVPFFDELIRMHHKLQSEIALQTLKAAIGFYAIKRKGSENKLVIKADSWHVLFHKQLRKLYPKTPFVLLYRKPVEVINSQQKRRGMQAVPGLIDPSIFEFEAKEILNMPLDEYMAKVLEKYFETFLQILNADKNAYPINYNEGTSAMIEKISDRAGIALTKNDWEQIKDRSTYHAKYPEQAFHEENQDDSVPSYLAKSTDLYNQVETIRAF